MLGFEGRDSSGFLKDFWDFHGIFRIFEEFQRVSGRDHLQISEEFSGFLGIFEDFHGIFSFFRNFKGLGDGILPISEGFLGFLGIFEDFLRFEGRDSSDF